MVETNSHIPSGVNLPCLTNRLVSIKSRGYLKCTTLGPVSVVSSAITDSSTRNANKLNLTIRFIIPNTGSIYFFRSNTIFLDNYSIAGFCHIFITPLTLAYFFFL